MRRRLSNRYILLGIGLGVLALAIGAGTWLALATSMYHKVGQGHLAPAGPGGPLVPYSPPGEPTEAVAWREMKGLPLVVQEFKPTYTRIDGLQGEMSFRVVEDLDGQRWVVPAQGSNPPVASPDRPLYFFEDWGQLYLLDSKTLQASRLTPWQYQGKAYRQIAEEQGRPIFWASWPLWTPDGRAVVYTTDRSGDYELFTLDVATRSETVVTSCGGEAWSLHGWTSDGGLVARNCEGDDNPETLFLVDLKTGAREQLMEGYHTDVQGPYVISRETPDASSRRLFYDANRRTTLVLPPPPDGYYYTMPFCPSPTGLRAALWLSTKEGSLMVGVLHVARDPVTLQTYSPPHRFSGGLSWLDDETLVVQAGTLDDPDRATYVLKVGGIQ